MNPILKRRRLLKTVLLGIGAVIGSRRMGNVGSNQNLVTTGSQMMSLVTEETPLWREIPDNPDGRPIPGFLKNYQYMGLTPKVFAKSYH